MKAKIIKWGFLVLVVVIIGGLITLSYRKYNQKEQLKQSYSTMPVLPINSILNDTIKTATLYNDMYSVVVYFNSHCEFCKLELHSFKKHKDEISGIQFAFISAEPVDTLRRLKKELDFSELPAVDVYYSKYEDLTKIFGTMGTPTIFLYDKQNKLIKEFKGFTKMVEILQTIRGNQTMNDEQ